MGPIRRGASLVDGGSSVPCSRACTGGRRWIPPGEAAETWIELSAADGGLRARIIEEASTQEFTLAFYRDHSVVRLDDDGQPTFKRSDFVPGPDGRIAWFMLGGPLYARQG
jgi:hypothetical protein